MIVCLLGWSGARKWTVLFQHKRIHQARYTVPNVSGFMNQSFRVVVGMPCGNAPWFLILKPYLKGSLGDGRIFIAWVCVPGKVCTRRELNRQNYCFLGVVAA